jgi:hypothetical protein
LPGHRTHRHRLVMHLSSNLSCTTAPHSEIQTSSPNQGAVSSKMLNVSNCTELSYSTLRGITNR